MTSTDVETFLDVAFADTPNRPLKLDVVRPATLPTNPMPAIIFLHGGGWYTGDKSPAYNQFLAEAGYFTICPQYRLSHEATFPAPIFDVKAAVRWLRAHVGQYHIDPNRIGIWGHSAGGHMAVFSGLSAGMPDFAGDQHPDVDDSVQAVVNVSGVTFIDKSKAYPADSPVGRLLGAAPADVPELARAFSPMAHLNDGADVPPLLILHGTDDSNVPPRHSELLYDTLRAHGADATYIPIAGGDHMLAEQWPIVEHLTREFFDRVLRGVGRTL